MNLWNHLDIAKSEPLIIWYIILKQLEDKSS